MTEYPSIDMKMTGMRIKNFVKNSGYSVRQIQEYLRLSCPQPIYRWFKGQILPSLDNLYALSRLLHVHMDELIVSENANPYGNVFTGSSEQAHRVLAYYFRLCQIA